MRARPFGPLPVIQFRHLTLARGARHLIEDADLQLHAGWRVGVVGANGGGVVCGGPVAPPVTTWPSSTTIASWTIDSSIALVIAVSATVGGAVGAVDSVPIHDSAALTSVASGRSVNTPTGVNACGAPHATHDDPSPGSLPQL